MSLNLEEQEKGTLLKAQVALFTMMKGHPNPLFLWSLRRSNFSDKRVALAEGAKAGVHMPPGPVLKSSQSPKDSSEAST